MRHPTAEKRHNDWHKALRKRKIDRFLCSSWNVDWYDNLHQYSKNKIHCSCPLCNAKTNSKKAGKRGPAVSRTMHDERQYIEMNQQEDEYAADLVYPVRDPLFWEDLLF